MRARNAHDDILVAARAVVSRDGPGRLTIDAVAREIGMSKGGVLYNFPSKPALLEGLMRHMIESFEQSFTEFRTAADGRTNPTLRALVGAYRHFETFDPDLYMAIMAAAAEAPDLMVPVNRLLTGYVDQVLAESSDPPLALVILAALDGLRFQHLMRMPPADPEHRAATLERILELIETLEPKA
jgi:AcrR family transcriptional regulator